MGDLAGWLAGIGLSQYRELFAVQAIDDEILSDITDQDLERLGLPLGHRKKVLKAIAASLIRGAALPDEAPTLVAPNKRASGTVPERRHLTLMFCDLVGSTELAARLDPEDLREIIRMYQDACAGAVTRFEGHVIRFAGDGVFACFGYPRAHEDDAERAVQAGLRITKSMRKLRLPGDIALQVRVGIETGLVVVGDLIGALTTDEQAVVGETPNLAARLQVLAEPNAVVIGPGTQRLVGRRFDLTELGPQPVKGFAQPVPVWRVTGVSAETRFTARANPLTKLIGREQELALLIDRWHQAKHGEGQVVLLSGEAGVGKSRLAETLLAHVAEGPHTVVRYQCSPYHKNTAFFPVIRQLESAAAFTPRDSSERKLDKLEALVDGAAEGMVAAQLFAFLLSIPQGERYSDLDPDPQSRKQRTFAALLDQLLGLARRRPVLILLEDAHWIDPTTQEFFNRAVTSIRALPVLLLVTFRAPFIVPWSGHGHITALLLNHFGRHHSAALVGHVAALAHQTLPSEIVGGIVARADGIPLFIEELTKAVVGARFSSIEAAPEPEPRPQGSFPIPETLQDSLMARLDSLGPAKEIAQLGAVIGREFSYDLLSAIVPDLAHQLPAALQQLTQAQLILEQGTSPNATYSFKHALVQEAAYAALLRSRRQEVHVSIARAMEERFPATIEAQPQLMAHHYTEAGLREPAIEWWHRAGLQALERSANVEAQSHIATAIELLEALPESPDRDAHELDLRLRLGAALVGTKGYAVPEFEANYERAWVLSERIGDPVRIFPALNGRWLSSFCRGDLPVAAARAQQFLDVAERQGDAGSQMMGHQILGITQSFRGDGLAARASLERAIALYDPQAHASYIQLYGRNPKVCSLGYLSFAVQQLGYPDHASKVLVQARTEGAAGHFVTTALVLLFTCIAAVLRRDMAALEGPANELLTLARRHGSQYWELHGRTFVARLQATEGHVDEALKEVRTCLFGWEARRSGFMRPWLKLMEIELLFELGQHGEALRHLDKAGDLIERTDIRFCEAELLRLRAGVLSAHGASDAEVDACFREAVAVARRQSAKFWELRAVTSWARFHRDRQRHALARELLQDVYAWFTEGLDTPDLQEARALLDSLGSAVAQEAASIRRPEGAPALRLVVGQ